jgi:hypothetical protein
MTGLNALYATLSSAAVSLWAHPALVLAQQSQQPGAPAPGTSGGSAGASQGGAGWLWIIAAIVVLAIIWWAMSSRRRRGTMTR